MFNDLSRQNGSIDHVLNCCVERKLSTLLLNKVLGLKKRPGYIGLPYVGDSSCRFEGQIR